MKKHTKILSLRSLTLATALAATGAPSLMTAQSLVKDPFFKTASSWTVVDATRTKIVSWGPLTIDLVVRAAADADKTVGVTQMITVQNAGDYQLIMNVDTTQTGTTTALPFDCTLMQGSTKVLDASGTSNPGPDTRMNVARLSAGNYALRVTSKTRLENTSSTRHLVNVAVFLRPVTRPVPSFTLVSSPTRLNQVVAVRGAFTSGARTALYYFSTHRLSTPLRFPGITGDVFLDPVRGSGIHVTLLEPTTKTIVLPWGRAAWPGYHCQVVELDASQMTLRIGSRTFTRP